MTHAPAPSTSVHVRRATHTDLPALAALGTALARQHVGYDPRRFVFPTPIETAHASFFAEQLANPESVLLVAVAAAGSVPASLGDVVAPDAADPFLGSVVGYAFARCEPASFVDALPASGWVHDLYVAPTARGRGAGLLLLDASLTALRARGVMQVLLGVAPANTVARRLFAARGFRTTLHEITLGPP
jgi:ribosomal protein S18 acetylase RimI-like enzyme